MWLMNAPRTVTVVHSKATGEECMLGTGSCRLMKCVLMEEQLQIKLSDSILLVKMNTRGHAHAGA